MGESDVCGLTAAGQAGAREKRVARGEVVSGVQEHPWQVRHRDPQTGRSVLLYRSCMCVIIGAAHL